MENPESSQYRDELAEELKNTPHEERGEVLEQTKETSEYWQARGEKISQQHTERQDEEEIDGGLGVFIKRKIIYHGSGIGGIQKFTPAEEDTVGSGIYFTSQPKDAIGYARIRSKRERSPQRADGHPVIENSVPVIYESSIENIKLCDLTKDENATKILLGLRQFLHNKEQNPELNPKVRNFASLLIKKIDTLKVGAGNLKLITQQASVWFSQYVQSLGYNGLIALEGGEGGNGNHDSYVIFDPEKARIVQEHSVV